MAERSNGTGVRLSASELAAIAKEAIGELTGYPPESVSGLQWDGDNWLVTVDVCELERIPSTTDVIATFEVRLDEQGRLVGYRRVRRFIRGRAEED